MSLRASSALFVLAILAVLAPVRSAPTILIPRHDGHADETTTTPPNTIQKQNGLDAQQLNVKFTTLKDTDVCNDGEMACVSNSFAQCVLGKWALTPCTTGLQCVALPLVNKPGTSIVCDSPADAITRFEAAGVSGGPTGTGPNKGAGNSTDTTNNDQDGDCEDDDTDAGQDTNGDDDQECDDGDDGDTTTSQEGSSTSAETPNSTSTAKKSPEVITITVTATPTTNAKSIGSTILLDVGKPTSTAPLPSSNAGGYAGYKRQAVSSINPSNSVSSIVPVTVTVTPTIGNTAVTSAAVPTVTLTPGTQINVPTPVSLTTSASAGVEPTSVVVGADGIRTITVVSTVTVGCGAPTAPTVSPTIALPSSSSSPSSPPIFTTVTVTPTSGSTSVTVLTSAATSSSVVVQSSSSPASSPSGIIFSTPSSLPAPASSATGTSTPSTNRGGFSFSTAPSPTPAPQGGVNNGSGKSLDLSELLTATVGSA